MDGEHLSRRGFLALAGGVVLLAACGSDDDGEASPTSDDATTSAPDHTHGAREPIEHFHELRPGVVSSDLYASGSEQRLAFAMTAKEGFASGAPVRLAVAPPGEEPVEFFDTTLHTEGLPERRGVYVAYRSFPVAGTWSGIAETDGTQIPFVFAVKEQAEAPVPGGAAPTTASPTPAEPLGTDPICTREPMCELHEHSLDALVGAGRPVAVLFATPALCQTAYCGPVLDSLLPLVDEYRNAVDVVHVEIYTDNRSGNLVPTVSAWGLPSEPWLFGIDSAGSITARLDGAFGTEEMRELLEGLANPPS